MATKNHDSTVTFEQALHELEEIVSQLESGDVPLEKAIELYQKGIQISKMCRDKLQFVEQKIEILIESETGEQRKPFSSHVEEQVKSSEQ